MQNRPGQIKLHNWRVHSVRKHCQLSPFSLCAVLCRAVLCRAVLCCCAVLCCAVLCCAVLCCAVLCCAVLCCAVLRCAVHQEQTTKERASQKMVQHTKERLKAVVDVPIHRPCEQQRRINLRWWLWLLFVRKGAKQRGVGSLGRRCWSEKARDKAGVGSC